MLVGSALSVSEVTCVMVWSLRTSSISVMMVCKLSKFTKV